MAVSGKFAEIPHTLEWRRAYDAFMRNQRMHARSVLPISMVGFARGLAEVGKGDNKVAALLGDVLSFMTRHNHGEVPLVGLTNGEDLRLLEAVHQVALEENNEECEAPAVVIRPGVPPVGSHPVK